MILPSSKDALHRGQLFRLLVAIADSTVLSKCLIFKGGTCAALLGKLDRFSVDLDFDLVQRSSKTSIRRELEQIFIDLNFSVKKSGANALQYELKYEAPENYRHTLQIDAVDFISNSSSFKPMYLIDIDRHLNCHTIETMVAHKLVALTERFTLFQAVAGRDVYDIHYFFNHGCSYNHEVIVERTGMTVLEYFVKLEDFVTKHVDQKVIDQDLNTLLPYPNFLAVRKTLKIELLAILRDQILLLSH